MILMEIVAKSLSQSRFEQYGDVIESRGSFKEINNGLSKKWNSMVTPLVFNGSNGGINLGVIRSMPFCAVISQMERHFFTSQIFIPMVSKRYLIVVAQETGKYPIAEQVEAFFTDAKQGICFHPKTWHSPLIPLEEEMEFVSIMKNSEIPDVEVMSFENENSVSIML